MEDNQTEPVPGLKEAAEYGCGVRGQIHASPRVGLEETIDLDKLTKAHTLSADAIRNVIRSAALQTLSWTSEVILLATAAQAFFTATTNTLSASSQLSEPFQKT